MSEMQSNKILTVSVAAYNAGDYLREVLDSFVELPQIELLEVFVVDDGGTDDSLEIAKEYQNRFPGVFYAIHKENGGWGSTVSYSIKHAHGKYFRLLDGDDYYNKENLADFIKYIAQNDSDMFISPYVAFEDGTGNELETVSADCIYKENKKYLLKDVKEKFPLAMHAITVRTSLLQDNNVNLKEHCLYRDMEYTANILSRAKSVMFFDKPIYFYRIGRVGQSVSHAAYIKHIDEHADIVYSILEFTKKPEAQDNKRLIYSLAKGACSHQYNIYFYSEKIENVKVKLREFDGKIKEYPMFYKRLKLPIYIKLLQKTNFIGYEFVKVLLYIKRSIKK